MNPLPRQLEILSSDEFLSRFAQIGTIEGLYSALRRSGEVRSLSTAIREESIGESEVDRFVRSLLREFKHGEQFPYQLSLAAIAVACIGISKEFSRKFVSYLASLRSVELLVASQVAEHCLQFISTTTRETISEGNSIKQFFFVERPPRSHASQTAVTFDGNLVDA